MTVQLATTGTTPWERISPIGLAELVQEAELLTRVDRKYVVSCAELPDLLAALPAGTRILDIDGRRQFGYRSTYLDTPERLSYLSSGRSHRRRWKVRGRTYLDTGGSWLEIKTAGPRGRTLKQRVPHAEPSDGGFCVEASRFVAGVIGAEPTAALEPVLTTTYRRATLLLRSGARVTVDRDLTWRSLATGAELSRPSLAVVETKGGSTPTDVDRALWSSGHRPARISKYGAGMAALDPDLPRLKWHRALVRHLDLPLTTSRSHP